MTQDLPAGVDHLSLDQRKFHFFRQDLEQVCRFFALGTLKHYAQEKNIAVSHSNPFVYAATSRGEYAFKFYPAHAARQTTLEYALNRVLVRRHFPTPRMHAGPKGCPYTAINNRLAVCFSYLNGQPAWQRLGKPETLTKIQASLHALNSILDSRTGIPCLKQENLAAAIKTLVKTSAALAPYKGKDCMDAALKDALHAYQYYRPLFQRRLVHNNLALTNILFYKGKAFCLDFSHAKEDYVLSDLAGLMVSCLFFKVADSKIKAVARDYFALHKTPEEFKKVLNVLLNVGLVKEYLKNAKRQKSLKSRLSGLLQTFSSGLSERRDLIMAGLQRAGRWAA